MLIVDDNHARREELSRTLRLSGFPVCAVPSISDVERWPAGQVVITSAEQYTPLWNEVGASHVIVLTETDEEGEALRARGASAWVSRNADPQRPVFLAIALSMELRVAV